MTDHPHACGATNANVIGRCGRDVGHDGPHRSTAETFEAFWVDTPHQHTRRCEPATGICDTSEDPA